MRQLGSLLLATTNDSKAEELRHALADLPFTFLTLNDAAPGIAVTEDAGTLDGNAMKKAIACGTKTGTMALADDTGLFIEALGGWPGVESARIGPDPEGRNREVLKRLEGIEEKKREAIFRCSLCLYEPHTGSIFITHGEVRGSIVMKEQAQPHGFGYDPIFFVPKAGKTFAEMTMAEKNEWSHRGQAVLRMKYVLQNQFGGKHIVVPVAFPIQNGKLLMSLRNDPFRPLFHKKWEFPGGRMDMGETLEDNLVREVKEEVGYTVEPVARLNHLWVEHQSGPGWAYQVYLIPYVCRIIGGNGVHRDAEVLKTKWFDPDEVSTVELIGNNAAMFQTLLPDLVQAIKTNNL